MADWQFKLNFKEFWDDEEMPIFTKAEKVAEGIKALLPEIRKRAGELKIFKLYRDYAENLEELADDLESNVLPMFEELFETENEDANDFDYALEALYDWADTPLDNRWGGKKMCWVSTVI